MGPPYPPFCLTYTSWRRISFWINCKINNSIMSFGISLILEGYSILKSFLEPCNHLINFVIMGGLSNLSRLSITHWMYSLPFSSTKLFLFALQLSHPFLHSYSSKISPKYASSYFHLQVYLSIEYKSISFKFLFIVFLCVCFEEEFELKKS